MNPFIKLICLIIFIISLFLSYDSKINIMITIFLIILILNTLIPLSIYFKLIYKMKWFLLFIIIINIIFKTPNNIILIITLRIIYTVIIANIFLMTTTLNDITYSLEKLFSPLKLIGVKVNRMALSISLALRFIPSLYEEANKILKSQASRGLDYRHGIKNKIVSLTSLIFPLFNISLKKADDLSDIMHVRLYDIDKKRSLFKKNMITSFDIIMLSIHIAVLIIVVKDVII
jgi:energy-coupling factor transport system permease protein